MTNQLKRFHTSYEVIKASRVRSKEKKKSGQNVGSTGVAGRNSRMNMNGIHIESLKQLHGVIFGSEIGNWIEVYFRKKSRSRICHF